MYSHVRALQIPVRSLAAGDTLEYRVRWTQTRPDIPDQFWYTHDFINEGAVKSEMLTVDVPADKYVKVAGARRELKIYGTKDDPTESPRSLLLVEFAFNTK